MRYLFCFLFIFCPTFLLQAQVSEQDLLAQLKGDHCKFEWKYVAEEKRKRCVARSFSFFRWLFTAREEADCGCRGHAAQCLASQDDISTTTTSYLSHYLKDGVSDVDNGDGGSACLSRVITTIGHFAKDSTKGALIDYLRSPRRAIALEGATKPGYYVGIREALQAMSRFKGDIPEAIEPLREMLKREERPFPSFRPLILLTLGSVGDKKLLDDSAKEIALLNKTLESSTDRSAPSVVADLERVYGFLGALDIWAQRDASALASSASALYGLIDLYSRDVPRWVKKRERAKISTPTEMEGLRRLLTDIKRRAILILARLKDPKALPHLPELLSLPHVHREEVIQLFLQYGEKIEQLYLDMIVLAMDLQFQDIPLDQTISGTKNFRAASIIEIMKRRGGKNSIGALQQIGKNKYLRRRAARALESLGEQL